MINGKIKIPFHLCDPAQILFFGSVFEIYHNFLEENIHHLGVSWKTWFKGEAAAPIRGVEADYQSPLEFGEIYDASLKVKKIGNSTVTFQFSLSKDNNKNCDVFVTHCFIDPKSRSKVQVSNEVKSAFLKHLIND